MAAIEKSPADETTVYSRPQRADRAAAFDALCHWLRPEPALPPSSVRDEELDWVALVEQANRERVVTNLYWAFASRGWPTAAPADLRDYLTLVYDANAAQNRLIRQQALDIADAFARMGVRYAFLKGANWLLETDEERIGERWLSDIDLVVDPRDWTKALATLDVAGFRPVIDPALYARHFHHVPLARPDDRVTVELHRHLGWQRHLLRPEEVVAGAFATPGSPPLRLSNPAHRFIFGCLHAQLQDMGYATGQFSLRDLCDIRYLAATQRDALDWAQIAGFARERGIYRYLAASLQLCHRLLGLALPAPFSDSAIARHHAAFSLFQHRGYFPPRVTALTVKVAWLFDERRIAYELDCEEAPWPARKLRIARGRVAGVVAALMRRRRSPESSSKGDAS